MQYHQLGSSTLDISTIGFGCMSLGKDHQANEQLINRSIELGINFYDTADMYDKGLNETTVGKIIKSKRSSLIIATKVGNVWKDDGSGWDWNPKKEYILSAVEKSLQRLQTDYIDLYQLHGGTIEDPIDETIEAFEILKQQGKIRFYGISSIRPNVIRAYVSKSQIVSVMMQYSLLDRRPEESCLSLLHDKNIGVLARGSLARGLLVDKPASAFLQYSAKEVKTAADRVRSLPEDKRTPAQTALKFALANIAVTSAIVGLRTIEQLENIVEAVETSPLSEEEIKTLSQSIEVNFYDLHR